MNSNSTENKGNIKISEDAIAECIKKTAIETNGVSALVSTRTTEVFTKNFSIKESPHKGIRISKNENGYIIDLHILVSYDVNIPSVAWDLQKNIKKALQRQFDITPEAINVHVQGVKFPADFRRA